MRPDFGKPIIYTHFMFRELATDTIHRARQAKTAIKAVWQTMHT